MLSSLRGRSKRGKRVPLSHTGMFGAGQFLDRWLESTLLLPRAHDQNWPVVKGRLLTFNGEVKAGSNSADRDDGQSSAGAHGIRLLKAAEEKHRPMGSRKGGEDLCTRTDSGVLPSAQLPAPERRSKRGANGLEYNT
jgi:hypothetical protein